MDGAPIATVVRVLTIRARVAAGSKRSTSPRAPPLTSVPFMMQVIPSTCENGAAASWTSSGPRAKASMNARAFHSIPAWLSSAAFALPVVPDVKVSTATSSGARPTRSSRLASGTVRPAGSTTRTPAFSAPSASASAAVVTNSDGSATCKRSRTSRGRSNAPSGATVAPRRSTAKNASTNAGEFGSQIATDRPGWTPRRRSAPAKASIRRPSSPYEIASLPWSNARRSGSRAEVSSTSRAKLRSVLLIVDSSAGCLNRGPLRPPGPDQTVGPEDSPLPGAAWFGSGQGELLDEGPADRGVSVGMPRVHGAEPQLNAPFAALVVLAVVAVGGGRRVRARIELGPKLESPNRSQEIDGHSSHHRAVPS